MLRCLVLIRLNLDIREHKTSCIHSCKSHISFKRAYSSACITLQLSQTMNSFTFSVVRLECCLSQKGKKEYHLLVIQLYCVLIFAHPLLKSHEAIHAVPLFWSISYAHVHGTHTKSHHGYMRQLFTKYWQPTWTTNAPPLVFLWSYKFLISLTIKLRTSCHRYWLLYWRIHPRIQQEPL